MSHFRRQATESMIGEIARWMRRLGHDRDVASEGDQDFLFVVF